MTFARDAATHAYYEARAAEYDEWYAGTGAFADRDRPGWAEEVARLVAFVAGLPEQRTLDVACGTAFLTRHLEGYVVGLDQSAAMVAIAQARLPQGLALAGDALALPFADRSCGWQTRVLNDGSEHRVFKRYLSAEALAAEIGGEPLLDGRWFSAARALL